MERPEQVEAGSEFDRRWEPSGLAAMEKNVERDQEDKMLVEKGQIKVILRRMDSLESRVSDLEDQMLIVQEQAAEEDEMPEVGDDVPPTEDVEAEPAATA